VTSKDESLIPALVLADADELGDESEALPADSGVEEQAFWHRKAKAKVEQIDLDPETLRASLDDLTAKLELVLANQTDRPNSSFALDSFSVGLAVNATGKLFLVAEVGIEASIELTFTRKR
jgi:hypothetical protein